ncbi:cell division protein FtsQ/DivIB [Schaalia sp. lx-100]|uniref:cell division protein FtsQ/DivIB n=1 Tax=Schaalia sp. lx-100 TaxID=2899081 RepID=UPI001E56C11C|nr:hypothetical protein [Schaalia sp. lx-100]MCD4557054.1 hypothetical protein [Schaalia sp. lx-100]
MKTPPRPRRSSDSRSQDTQGREFVPGQEKTGGLSQDSAVFTEAVSSDLEQSAYVSIRVPEDTSVSRSVPVGASVRQRGKKSLQHRRIVQEEARQSISEDSVSGTVKLSGRRHRLREVLRRPIGSRAAVELMGVAQGAPVASATARLEEKRRARRRLRAGRYIVACFSVLAVALCVWGVFFSRLFALEQQQIQVTGSDDEIVSPVAVVESVEQWYGVPLTRLSLSSIAEHIRHSFPQVKDVEVKRRYPVGLDIVLTLREVVLSERLDSSWNHVDESGVILRRGQGVPAEGTARVVLPQEEGRERTQAAAALYHAWTALGTDLQSQCDLMSSDGMFVTFTLTSGASVVWGTDEAVELKSRVLAILVAERSAATYDVSAPTRPVIR